MSIDRSLKVKGALSRHRNVLSRTERIDKLKDEERWSEGNSLFGLPKVAHRKSHAGKKAKEEAAAEGVVAGVMPEGQAMAGAKPAAPAAGAASAKTAGAKAAAPAKQKTAEKPKDKGKPKEKSK